MQFPDIIILAGGLGTRLRSVVDAQPKAMAVVAGKPFLEFQLNFIGRFGFRHIIIASGYKGDQISAFFGNSYRKLQLEYSREDEPLCTGGAIKKAFALVTTPHVMILNGDTMFRMNLDRFFQQHIEDLATLSIGLRRVDDSSRYGTVLLDNARNILSFQEKQASRQSGLINGGVYLIKSSGFSNADMPDQFSLEHDFFPKIVASGSVVKGYVSSDYFLDIGIPEDYQRAQNEFNAFEN